MHTSISALELKKIVPNYNSNYRFLSKLKVNIWGDEHVVVMDELDYSIFLFFTFFTSFKSSY